MQHKKGQGYFLAFLGSFFTRYLFLGLWLLLNICLTLQNKVLLSSNFSFPFLLSAAHTLCCWLLSIPLTWNLESPRLTQRQRYSLYLFSVLYCFNICFGNLVMQYVSVAFLQVVRSIIPALTMILSSQILGQSFQPQYFGAVSFLVIGVTMATIGESESTSFTWIGFALSIFVCLLSSTKSVVSSKFLQGEVNLHPSLLLSYLAPPAFFQMVMLAFLSGEFHEVLPLLEKESNDFVVPLIMNSFLALLLNLSNFYTTKLTSALTVTVAGNIKHVVTIILSVIIFQTSVSLMNGIGMILTMLGAAWYSWCDFQLTTEKTPV